MISWFFFSLRFYQRLTAAFKSQSFDCTCWEVPEHFWMSTALKLLLQMFCGLRRNTLISPAGSCLAKASLSLWVTEWLPDILPSAVFFHPCKRPSTDIKRCLKITKPFISSVGGSQQQWWKEFNHDNIGWPCPSNRINVIKQLRSNRAFVIKHWQSGPWNSVQYYTHTHARMYRH